MDGVLWPVISYTSGLLLCDSVSAEPIASEVNIKSQHTAFAALNW